MYCLLCSGPAPRARLCTICGDVVASERGPRQFTVTRGVDRLPVLSLARYNRPIASLILRAKIRGDLRALGLIEEWVEDEAVRAWTVGCVAVMAAPSSLWGRLRGKLDLAAVAAARLATVHGLDLQRAPLGRFWRLKKRAMMSRTVRRRTATIPEEQPGPSRSDSRGPLLIVDDVVTTGLTLCSLLPFAARREARALTLADAWREKGPS